MSKNQKIEDALKASRLYFYQNMTTLSIAREMHISSSTVSRLINFARREGLVTIQVSDPENQPVFLERAIRTRYQVRRAHVVPVSDQLGEAEWLERTAQYSARYLNSIIDSNMLIGVAWGTTLSSISKYLLPKTTHNAMVVQLNGAGNTQTSGIHFAGEIITRIANNFQARAELFPVPTFFDHPETKKILWKERSIQRILALQHKADLLIYSIGAVNAGVPSHVYSGGYLESADFSQLREYQIVGDIATVFFRADGTYQNIPLNTRSSGPNLDLFKSKYGICIVSGLAKATGLRAALKGGLIKEIIVDEPTARQLVNTYPQDSRPN